MPNTIKFIVITSPVTLALLRSPLCRLAPCCIFCFASYGLRINPEDRSSGVLQKYPFIATLDYSEVTPFSTTPSYFGPGRLDALDGMFSMNRGSGKWQSKCEQAMYKQAHNWPFGKIDSISKLVKPRLNQRQLFSIQTNLKRTPMSIPGRGSPPSSREVQIGRKQGAGPWY